MNLHQLTLTLVIALASVCPQATHAQQSGAVSVEGYVFDKKTLKPLSGVNVSIIVVAPQGMTTAPAFVGRTDDSGFYSISEVPPYQPEGANVMSIRCLTRKGEATATGFVYDKIQTDRIYQRNFYLTLPRGVTKCGD